MLSKLDAPPRLLDTSTDHLWDRDSQKIAFRTSTQYSKLLLSLATKDANPQSKRIKDTVSMSFRYVMLSIGGRERSRSYTTSEERPSTNYLQAPANGIERLKSFYNIARVDQNNNVEVQRSLNSMFTWCAAQHLQSHTCPTCPIRPSPVRWPGASGTPVGGWFRNSSLLQLSSFTRMIGHCMSTTALRTIRNRL